MKALMCRAFGPPENLTFEEITEPIPGEGEVLVDVTCVGLNFADTLIIENAYQIKPPLPFSPGTEFCGRISGLGAGVTGWQKGERVAGFTGFGALAQRLVCKASQLVPVPGGVPDEQAAGLMVTYGTALHGLQDRAQMQAGETLAVLGASGGAGLAAVEIGVLLGAHVIACASSADKVALAKQAGAHEGLDYATQDLKSGLRTMTQNGGVDIVYDTVGDRLSEPALRALNWRGRLVSVGFAGGSIPKLPMNLMLVKGVSVTGVNWGAFATREPEAWRQDMESLFTFAGASKLKVPLHGVLPFERVVEGLTLLKQRKAHGKIIIQMP